MNKKRYYKFLDDKQEWVIRDRTNRRNEFRVGRNKRYAEKIVDKLNEQQARIEMLEKGILDCLFDNKSIGMFALDMGLVE